MPPNQPLDFYPEGGPWPITYSTYVVRYHKLHTYYNFHTVSELSKEPACLDDDFAELEEASTSTSPSRVATREVAMAKDRGRSFQAEEEDLEIFTRRDFKEEESEAAKDDRVGISSGVSKQKPKITLDFGGQTLKSLAVLPGFLSATEEFGFCFVDNMSSTEKATQMSPCPLPVQPAPPSHAPEKKVKKERKKTLNIATLSDRQLYSFCGVNKKVFKFLLCKIKDSLKDSQCITREEKLFLCLARLKSASSYRLLGAYFGISESAVAKFFQESLDAVHEIARESLIWFDRNTVNARMPKAFKASFKNVRAIIDCSEIECEKSCKLRQRVLTYSQYKGHHTVKFLVAVAPSGEITFISPAFGGRSTDTEITVNSGFLELLEEGDVILGDNRFPSIEQCINEAGAFLVMPPFKSGEKQFTEKQNHDGYEVASVRVHVERAIERMKRFEVLSFLTIKQLEHIDKMLVIIAFLCNLLPDLICNE